MTLESLGPHFSLNRMGHSHVATTRGFESLVVRQAVAKANRTVPPISDGPTREVRIGLEGSTLLMGKAKAHTTAGNPPEIHLGMKPAYLLVLSVAALTVAIAIRALSFASANPPITIISVSSPTTVHTNEQYAVFGGLQLPEGSFEKRLRYCGARGCRVYGWGAVTGPAMWWGYIGTIEVTDPGTYEAELLLYERNSVGAWRAVARYAWGFDAK